MNDTTDTAAATAVAATAATTATTATAVPRIAQNTDLGEITRKTFWEKNECHFLGVGCIVLFLLAWQALPLVFTFSRGMTLFFTTPVEVFDRMFAMFGGQKLFDGDTIYSHLISSAKAFSAGLGLSVVVALPVGVILGRSRILDAMFDPFITAINATPRLVFLPIVMIWMGIGFATVTTIVFIGAVFPLLINTYAGVRNADRLLINVVRSFGANEWQINKLVVLPNSMPFIISGLRLAIGRAVLGIVVAEFFGGTTKGIGVVMVDASGKFHVDILFVGVLLFMALSLVMTSFVKLLENRLSRWRPEVVKTF